VKMAPAAARAMHTATSIGGTAFADTGPLIIPDGHGNFEQAR
jgi:hypothetical protein